MSFRFSFCRLCWIIIISSITASAMEMPDTTSMVVDWSLFMPAFTTSVGTMPSTIQFWKLADSYTR